jgi:two-component system, chemotaxis family, chemotaxis protein CheY
MWLGGQHKARAGEGEFIGMRCLIVEDNEMLREGLNYFMAGHAEIELAVNGREAVQSFEQALAQQNPFDLVLLDIIMPEMNGQHALKLMRLAERNNLAEKRKKAVIIMTTALHSPENMEEALWDGDCTDYLVKPIVRADLMTMLCKHGLI